MIAHRRAFTLLELLVVISIIAMLAALLMPVIQGAKRQSYAARSSANLRQLVTANIAYAIDRSVYAPANTKSNNRRWHGARTSTGSRFDPTKGFLADYLGKSGAVMADPLFTEMIKGNGSFEDGSGGYGYNASYIGGTPMGLYNSDGTRESARPSQLARPSSTIMFATTAYATTGGVQEYPFAEPPFWDLGEGPISSRPSPSVHFRFNGKAIVGWCDGHVTLEKLDTRDVGQNPSGGDAEAQQLGWFGPDQDNGFWNPNASLSDSSN